MNIAICDDEPNIVKIIRKKLVSINKHCMKIDEYFLGHDLIDNYNMAYDVIFLDINMKDSNGFEIAQEIRTFDRDVIIVFLTSNDGYVYDGYSVGAFRYILKNKFKEEIEGLMEKIRVNIHKQHWLSVRIKNTLLKININNICYLKSDLRKLHFVCIDGNNVEIYGSLSKYEEDLDKYGFVRTHQGYLINIKHATKFVCDDVFMTNGDAIPISRNKKSIVKEKVREYLC